MAEWESTYGGYSFVNERLLTKKEINKKYPSKDNSRMAKLTRDLVNNGFKILYGERPKTVIHSTWMKDVPRSALVAAAYLYKTHPDNIVVGPLTDLSNPNAIYIAVKRIN